MVELGHVLPSDRPRGMGARWTSSRAPESPGRGGRLYLAPIAGMNANSEKRCLVPITGNSAYCDSTLRLIALMAATPVRAMLTSSSLRIISIALVTPSSPPAPSP